jgi:hypothetical protein
VHALVILEHQLKHLAQLLQMVNATGMQLHQLVLQLLQQLWQQIALKLQQYQD